MCPAISDHHFIVQGTVDSRVYSVEMIHSCTMEMPILVDKLVVFDSADGRPARPVVLFKHTS